MVRVALRAAALAAAMGTANVATAQADAGAYLAARQAVLTNDFVAATGYFRQSLRDDPLNPKLLEGAMASYASLGQLDRAAPLAREMVDAGIESQIANLTLVTVNAANGDWDAIFEALAEGRSVSPLVDGLAVAWAALGQGDMTQATEAFDTVIASEGMGSYGRFHKALALGVVGDFEGAEALFARLNQRGAYSARAALGHAQALSQLGRFEEAGALLNRAFGASGAPIVSQMREKIAARNPIPFDLIDGARAGMGEVMFMIANVLRGETPDGYTLQYARMAQHLSPANAEATLLVGDLLDGLKRYDLASAAYRAVPEDDPTFLAAEIGRIGVLQRADRPDAAIEAAEALTAHFPDVSAVHDKLGDVLRMDGDYAAAAQAYTRAIELADPDAPGLWGMYYTRAIVQHQIGDWTPAEADFRAALALQPDSAAVLNYLGYSLVERGEKLNEALGMIERAVEMQPENGAIVDSLGWVLFKLGEYEDAVAYLERAAELEAVDPIVNDHLGDVYWAVGRETEAHFQWMRALSFEPKADHAERIRRKLEIGLDAVLVEEGRDPITVANDDT